MRKWLRWVSGVALLGVAALQFTNPPRVNPTVTPGHDLLATNAPPREIAALLKKSCYDCHSSETEWPWYSHIAPISWTLVKHVNDARSMLNFSEWPHDDPHKARKKWKRIADSVEAMEMPLPSYARVHRESRLSDDQRKKLVDWATQEAEKLAGR